MKTGSLILYVSALASTTSAQTFFAPSGTVGTSSNGNVGIGVSSPFTSLDIRGTGNQLFVSNGTGFYGIDSQSTIGTLKEMSSGLEFVQLNHGVGSVSLGTAGLNRLMVLNNGNVGIGTTHPNYLLEVKGVISATAISSTDGHVDLVPGGSGYGAYINWYKSGPTRLGYMGYQDMAGSPNNLALNLENSANFIIGGGGVGIGIANPLGYGKLAVSGIIAATSPDNGTVATAQGDNTGLVSIGAWRNAADSQLRFNTGNAAGVFTEKMRIDQNGNVGIGTLAPTQKLSVNGAIRAKEVIVDTSWSDYVFADDYKMASLGEVEKQIKDERHLPGVPSAKEVAEKGISLGEMQAKLLAKVEELTLRAIQQEKEIVALRAEVKSLRADIK